MRRIIGIVLAVLLAPISAHAGLVGITYEYTTSFGGSALLGVNVKGLAIYELSATEIPPTDDLVGAYPLLFHGLLLNNSTIAIAQAAPSGFDVSQVYFGNNLGGSDPFDLFGLESTFNKNFMGVTLVGATLSMEDEGPASALSSIAAVVPNTSLFPDNRQGILSYLTAEGALVSSFGRLGGIQVVATSVPEPGTLSLFAVGLIALGFIRWRTQARIR